MDVNKQVTITASFDEARQSQLAFVELLMNMGYTYIPCTEVMKQRKGDTSRFILRDIAFEALSRINSYEHDGERHQFSDKDIWQAIDELETIKLEGLVPTAKNIYNTIMPTSGGKTIKVFHGGSSESKGFRFIDFANPQNNSFHVAVEFEASGRANIRPDIVVFVNGIPFAIIENKKAGVEIGEAISQHLRNQQAEYCPRLYVYPQLLVAANMSEFRYGTTDTKAKFFVEWKEKDVGDVDRYVSEVEIDLRVKPLIEKKIVKDVYQTLLQDLNGYTGGHVQKTKRKIYVQLARG